MSEPLCLKHPGIQALLHALVDRLDQAAAQGKPIVQGIKLNATSFPALFKARFEEERAELWGYTEQLATQGWIRLVLDKGAPQQPGYELRPRVHVLSNTQIRAAVGRPVRIVGDSEVWRYAVNAGLEGTDEIRRFASAFRLDIQGRSAGEIVERLNLLHTLRDEPLFLREVSARLFWGSSKVLDKRSPLVAALLGLPSCPFPEIPIQLQVHLPVAGFSGVLFIENITTFEQAVRAKAIRFNGLALVFASGFKGTARRIRTEDGATVFFCERGNLESAERAKFLSWLRGGPEMPTLFWGDLDYAGMEILRALRTPFPFAEAWQAGYGPMLHRLEAGGGHDPEEAGKAAQREVLSTGCSYADTILLPAIRSAKKFVDQEIC
jgi:Uncharacterized protein conserved in bacteria C-term(DUF2220)